MVPLDSVADLRQIVPPVTASGLPPGAVVLGGDYQGLGIVRSLGRHGIPTCVIDDELSISRYSKYCGHFIKTASLRHDEEIIEALTSAAARLDLSGWVVYPTREEMVAALSRFRSELCATFRIPTPDWQCIQWAWNKHRTYTRAQELGIPTPATWYPRSISDVEQLADIDPPFAIKPAIKEHFIYAAGAKAWRAGNHRELRRYTQKALELVGPGEVMIQEFIPGGGSNQFAYCGFFRNGRPVGKMVVQRRRQHPVHFGRASTYVQTIDLPLLEEYSERFLGAIDYYGLAELEYKLDPRDGRYKLLDVNARTWGYHSLGMAAGVDFSHMLYADQMRQPVQVRRAPTGVCWMRATTDFPTAIMAVLTGKLTPRKWFRSVVDCDTDAVYSWDDPLPGLAEILLLPYLVWKRGI